MRIGPKQIGTRTVCNRGAYASDWWNDIGDSHFVTSVNSHVEMNFDVIPVRTE